MSTQQTLLERTLEAIEKAKEKGFEQHDNITPVMFEPWMVAELAFCNTACAILSMWLRSKKIFISIAPWFGEFSVLVVNPTLSKLTNENFGGYKTWEDAWLGGIKEALNLIK